MTTWARARVVLPVLLSLTLGTVALATAGQVTKGKQERKEGLRDDRDGDGDDHKQDICHFPPGNPANVHVIRVDRSAVPAHLAQHGDAVCADGASNCCFRTASSPSVCTSFATDGDNCGACGIKCPVGTACEDGMCVGVMTCPPPSVSCGASGCVNPMSDNQNCGACGNVCSAPSSCVGGTCVNVCSGVCAPGTTFCTDSCKNTQTDNENCGTCGNRCPPEATCTDGLCLLQCGEGQTQCDLACVDTETDPANCGACGNPCAGEETCIAGQCTTPTVAESCRSASALAVLIQGSDVTAYVPQGSWSEAVAGVRAVRVEGAGPSGAVATPLPVNSCSSNSGTGTTVCSGNGTDVYVINGTTVTNTIVDSANDVQIFSGGTCETCGVAIDAATGLAWLAEGFGVEGFKSGALEALDPATGMLGSYVILNGEPTSEAIAVDPVRSLILSANERNQFQIVDSSTGAVYASAVPFASPTGLGMLDSTAEDCLTGVAFAPFEHDQAVAFVNLAGAFFDFETWFAPTNVQDFSPDFANLLPGGTSGSAVAPGSHLAVITGESEGTAPGGPGFAVLQLPSSVTPSTVPMAVDWVSANVPNDPTGVPWEMGRDPHPVTAYVSPTDGRAYALIGNHQRTFLVKVDMALLLSAPRLPAPLSHTVDPASIPAGTFTFVPQM